MTRRRKRTLLIGAVFAAAGLGVFLVLKALGGSIAYFYTPADIAKLAAPPEGMVRLGGLVAAGSVAYPNDDAEVHFIIADEAATTKVAFRGILPDLFREGQGVVVQGRFAPDGTLVASEVLAKHDENYMPREVAEALKKQGRWKEGEEAAGARQ
ncbi:MAG: cytochrome c maturation protein CcmE [Amphiplicatus sp.]